MVDFKILTSVLAPVLAPILGLLLLLLGLLNSSLLVLSGGFGKLLPVLLPRLIFFLSLILIIWFFVLS